MRHTSGIETSRPSVCGRRRVALLAASQGLFSPTRAGRYFGGLWFKVFSERGPC